MSWQRDPPGPFRWGFGGSSGDGEFEIRVRTLLFVSVLIIVIFAVTFLFLYVQRLCRLVQPSPAVAPVLLHFAGADNPPRGLDLATINSMPIVLFRNLAGGGGGGGGFSEAECCICLGIFGSKERVKVLPDCRHRFHSECVDKWLAAEPSCPLCRAALRTDSPA